MRRKLIKQDAFDKIVNESVVNSERELTEAEAILSKTLNRDFVKLKSFTESTVLYECGNNCYIYAGYDVKEGAVVLSGVEELVIDEQSQRDKKRSFISTMLDSVILDEKEKAREAFNNYLNLVRWDEKNDNKNDGLKKMKAVTTLKKDKGKGQENDEDFSLKVKKSGKEVTEAYKVAKNVLDYVNFMVLGPTVSESISKRDDKGNIVELKIPTRDTRTQQQLQRNEWRILNSKIAEGRRTLINFIEDQDFCKAIDQLRKSHVMADANAFEENVNQIVVNYPKVLYATQTELSAIVGECLNLVGTKNFDDSTCEKLSEQILRNAQSTYDKKVDQIIHLANATQPKDGEDTYEHFKTVSESFYASLDEKFGLERQVFIDLYESLDAIYKRASRRGDSALKSETASYANDIAAVLNNEVRPNLELAEEAARFLINIIEANISAGNWVVSDKVAVSHDGTDYTVSTPVKGFPVDDGYEGNLASDLDDSDYTKAKYSKKLRDDGFSQEKGKGVYPNIDNPQLLPNVDYTMAHEKGVDKETSTIYTQITKDTWPNLTNPYLPKTN